jgi:hypothetical protein
MRTGSVIMVLLCFIFGFLIVAWTFPSCRKANKPIPPATRGHRWNAHSRGELRRMAVGRNSQLFKRNPCARSPTPTHPGSGEADAGAADWARRG